MWTATVCWVYAERFRRFATMHARYRQTSRDVLCARPINGQRMDKSLGGPIYVGLCGHAVLFRPSFNFRLCDCYTYRTRPTSAVVPLWLMNNDAYWNISLSPSVYLCLLQLARAGYKTLTVYILVNSRPFGRIIVCVSAQTLQWVNYP